MAHSIVIVIVSEKSNQKIIKYFCCCKKVLTCFLAGYTGANCETTIPAMMPNLLSNFRMTVNKCEYNPCQNSGDCIVVSYRLKKTACRCPPAFAGAFCEVSKVCADNPCSDAGMCLAMGSRSYVCICFAGFTGRRCDKALKQLVWLFLSYLFLFFLVEYFY